MDQTQQASRRVFSARSPKARASMTPSQLQAYFLARETLRRVARTPPAHAGEERAAPRWSREPPS